MFNMYNRRYTGSKYKLMKWIRDLIINNCTGNTFFDVFAGTGVVTEYLLKDFKNFIVNDFLYSNEVIYKGFLLQEEYDMNKLIKITQNYNNKNREKLEENYVSENFGDKFMAFESEKKAKKVAEQRQEIEKENK